MHKFIILLFLCSVVSAGAQNFKIHDVLVSAPDAQIGDIEMDPYSKRVCSQSMDNKLWVCRLDTVTWALVDPYGEETLVDSSLASLEHTVNGGEWGFDTSGVILTYTKVINRVRHIAVAAETPAGWLTTTLFDEPHRMNPHATQNPEDTVIIIHYRRNPFSPNTKYKFLSDPYNEHGVPWFYDAHWSSSNQVLTGILFNEQVGLFNPYAPTLPVQITDNPSVDYSIPRMWRAPEHLNARMLMARANHEEIHIYKELVRGSNDFSLYMQFSSPSQNPLYDKIASPEVVIYGQQSYITFMVSSSPYENAHVPAEIWIAEIDSMNPVFRMISDTSVSIRTDPEPFPTSERLLVYYTEVLNPSMSEPIYRIRKCETGILANPYTLLPESRHARGGSLVYPNPFQSRLFLWEPAGNEVFQLSNNRGQLIWSGNRLEEKDFSYLGRNEYFLRIMRENHVETVTVIKE